MDWIFWLHCTACDATRETQVSERALQRLSSGGFAPLVCAGCGAPAAVPGPRPWDLTPLDCKLLRSLRIAPE